MSSPRRTSPRVRRCAGVCIVPVGVVEKHGDHLPLGTDFMAGLPWLNAREEGTGDRVSSLLLRPDR